MCFSLNEKILLIKTININICIQQAIKTVVKDFKIKIIKFFKYYKMYNTYKIT